MEEVSKRWTDLVEERGKRIYWVSIIKEPLWGLFCGLFDYWSTPKEGVLEIEETSWGWLIKHPAFEKPVEVAWLEDLHTPRGKGVKLYKKTQKNT